MGIIDHYIITSCHPLVYFPAIMMTKVHPKKFYMGSNKNKLPPKLITTQDWEEMLAGRTKPPNLDGV